MNQEVETLTSSDSQSFFGHLTSEQDIPHTHTLRQISHWKTHTHTHTQIISVCQRTEEISSNVSRWTLTESMSGMEISPFWEPIHDAAFMATNCHSTCCSILQPYNQIRARRVAHTDPSTCVQTIIHCMLLNTAQIIAVSVFHYVSHLCWFLIGQLILRLPKHVSQCGVQIPAAGRLLERNQLQ